MVECMIIQRGFAYARIVIRESDEKRRGPAVPAEREAGKRSGRLVRQECIRTAGRKPGMIGIHGDTLADHQAVKTVVDIMHVLDCRGRGVAERVAVMYVYSRNRRCECDRYGGNQCFDGVRDSVHESLNQMHPFCGYSFMP